MNQNLSKIVIFTATGVVIWTSVINEHHENHSVDPQYDTSPKISNNHQVVGTSGTTISYSSFNNISFSS